MDLTALLEKNKSRLKSSKTVPARKPADIAEEDRPDSPPTSPIQQAKQTEHEAVTQKTEPIKPVEVKPDKLATNWQQTGNTIDNKVASQPATSTSCSSSFKDLKTTTTEIGDEWNFDITSYARFGFTKTQIKQLATSGVISAIDVEQSLIEFSYDLDNNTLPPIKTNKINFLMGLLWKGQSYVSEGFRNEQEATITEMARRARTAEKRESLLKEKFEAWEAELSNEERNEIEKRLPTHLMVLNRSYGIINPEVKNWYWDYFIQNMKG